MEPLGEAETGGRAALPIWMRYMTETLQGVPETPLEEPPGLVTVRIDSRTGAAAAGGEAGSVFETFRADQLPPRRAALADTDTDTETPRTPSHSVSRHREALPTLPEQLF
jgi:penicillin-binding protein 1A